MSDLGPLPREWLAPLAARLDETLAAYNYQLTRTIAALDAAISGPYGLFGPTTADADIRTACETVLAAPRDGPSGVEPMRSLVLYVDGSARGPPGPAGAGAVLQADGETLVELGRPIGTRTNNNIAEYAALHLGVTAAVNWYQPVDLEVRIDSMTVINDAWRDDGSGPSFAPYADAVATTLAQIPHHDWTHLADSDPNPADAQATVGADLAALGQ